MAMSALLTILALGGLSLASPVAEVEARQAASFTRAPACTRSGATLSRGYNCLIQNGAATASAFCSSRFVTTTTADDPTFTYDNDVLGNSDLY